MLSEKLTQDLRYILCKLIHLSSINNQDSHTMVEKWNSKTCRFLYFGAQCSELEVNVYEFSEDLFLM